MGIIKLPENVEFILDKLKEYGSIGYVVGGCVRDYILGKSPDDWDICSPLLPEVIENVFCDYKVIETGIKHGTVTVIINDEPYEITTFRIDGKYSDGRHPDNVDFTDRLEEDLKRRDFTINAMAYNPDVGIIDLFNGLQDIQDGVIRCVGNPYDRFNEDGLRILRALRFAVTLGFRIENQTLYAMTRNRKLLNGISKERICSEICKIMSTQFPNSFKVLYSCLELFYCITPYFDDSVKKAYKLFEHHEVIECLMATNRDDELVVRMALLLQFTDNPKEILIDMRMDNQRSKLILDILCHKDDYKHISIEPEQRKYGVRKLINEIGFRNLKNLCDYWIAKATVSCPINKFKYLKLARQMKVDAGIIISNNECCTLKQLDITGDDLIEIGYKPSEELGEILHLLLDEVMYEPYKNKKRWLITWVKEYLKERNEENATDEQMD